MITFEEHGDFDKLDSFFERLKEVAKLGNLDNYGRRGVEALRAATPVESGETAESWSYKIIRDTEGTRIEWHNSNINEGSNIAVLLQYGHGTRTGGYVEGIDYINPALTPLFEEIARDAWKEVNRG